MERLIGRSAYLILEGHICLPVESAIVKGTNKANVFFYKHENTLKFCYLKSFILTKLVDQNFYRIKKKKIYLYYFKKCYQKGHVNL